MFRYLTYAAVLLTSLFFAGTLVLQTWIDPNDYKPKLLSQINTNIAGKADIVGPIKWSFTPLALSLQDFSLTTPEEKLPFLTAKRARVGVSLLKLLSGKFSIDTLEFDQVTVKLRRSRQGTWNFQTLPLAPPQAATAASTVPSPSATSKTTVKLQIDALYFKNSNLIIEDAKLQNYWELKGLAIAAHNLSIDEDRIGAKVKLNGQISTISDPQEFVPVHLSFKVDTKLQEQQLTQAKLDRLQIAIDKGQARGHLLAEKVGEEASIDLSLQAKEFDLRKFMPKSAPNPPAAARSLTTSTDAPPTLPRRISLDGLRHTKVSGNIKASAITVSDNMKIHYFDANLTGPAGRLVVPAFDIKINGLKPTLSFSLDARQASPKLASSLTAEGFAIEELFTMLGYPKMLTGQAWVAWQVNTHGDSLQAWQHNLGGEAKLAVQDGYLYGVDLLAKLKQAVKILGGITAQVKADPKIALPTLMSANTVPRHVNQTQGHDKTHFESFDFSTQLNNSVGKPAKFELVSPKLSVRGAGKFEIPTQLLDFNAQASLTQLDTQAEDVIAYIKQTPLALNISGTFTQPKFRPDMDAYIRHGITAFYKTAIKSFTQRTVEKILPNSQDGSIFPKNLIPEGISNGFKGLFKKQQ